MTKRLAVHSIRKSFLSSLYGRTVAGGKLTPLSTLGQLGINDQDPTLTPTDLTCSVLDLLESTAGTYDAANYARAMQSVDRPDAYHARDVMVLQQLGLQCRRCGP